LLTERIVPAMAEAVVSVCVAADMAAPLMPLPARVGGERNSSVAYDDLSQGSVRFGQPALAAE